jgi:hypothetical protein
MIYRLNFRHDLRKLFGILPQHPVGIVFASRFVNHFHRKIPRKTRFQ